MGNDRTDLRSSCFMIVYKNLEHAASVGMVRLRRMVAMATNVFTVVL